MTITGLIKLADELRAELPELEKVEAYETPPSVLPPGCPLYANLTNAGKLFGISEPTMRSLLKNNADFPAVRMGSKYIVDVPGLYRWMGERHGETMEI